MQRNDIVKNLSEIIHREAPEAKVILYGSEARGDAGTESDIGNGIKKDISKNLKSNHYDT
jgi:predicted nucleotidyltransferase